MNLKFYWIVFGIFFSFLLYGTLQEKLLKGTFGDNEKFTFVMPLMAIQNFVALLYGLFVRTMYPYTLDRPVPTLYSAVMGLLQVLAMGSSFMALQWVSYPAQVLAKSSKPIPVLIMGVLVGEKSYSLRKYLIVFLIVFGVTTFFYNSEKASSSSFTGIGLGEVLLLMSLVMDGLLNSTQERIMSSYKPNSNDLMIESNKWVIIITCLISLLSGEGLLFVNFIFKYPGTISLILAMSVCFAFGQFFIFKGITELGTLTVSIITTTRKFFTVLGSVIVFGHQFSYRQWFSVFCVFSGLILDTYVGKSSKKPVAK